MPHISNHDMRAETWEPKRKPEVQYQGSSEVMLITPLPGLQSMPQPRDRSLCLILGI